jgi:hypothetical protein
VRYEFEGDITALRAELAKVPGATKESVDRMVAALERDVKLQGLRKELAALPGVSKTAASRMAAELAKIDTRPAVSQIQGLAGALRSLGFGLIAERATSLATAISGLGLPIAAAGAAAAGLALGLGAIGAAAVRAIRDVDALIAELETLGREPAIDDATLAQMREASKEMGDLRASTIDLQLALGGALAPEIATTTRVIALLVDTLGGLSGALRTSIQAGIESARYTSLFGFVAVSAAKAIGAYADSVDEAAEAEEEFVGPTIDALTLSKRLDAEREAAARRQAARAKEAARNAAIQAGAIEKIGAVAEEAAEDQLTAEQRIMAAAFARIAIVREQTDVLREQGREIEALAFGEIAAGAIRERAIRDLAQLTIDEARRAQAAVAELAATTAATIDQSFRDLALAVEQIGTQIEQTLAGLRVLATEVVGGIASTALSGFATLGTIEQQRLTDVATEAQSRIEELQAARIDAIERGDEAAARAAKAEMDRQRAAAAFARQRAIAQFREVQSLQVQAAFVEGTRAAISLIPSFAQIPFGLGVPAALALAAATTASQVAIIRATEPPSFHAGGIVRAPDEVPAILTAREAVLTQRGVESIGGEEAVERANRGDPPAMGPITVQVVLDGRVIRETIADVLRSGIVDLRGPRVPLYRGT